jgi:excinuclease ABC subunit A
MFLMNLHPRDNERLIQTLLHLRDLGNTVLVVEHDQETMERSDWILDLGPGAGALGGNLVAAGTLEKILSTPQSLTGKYLRGEFKIEVPLLRRKGSLGKSIEILGASQNNLRDVDVRIPIGTFTCVTGVSGSGKSTLILDTLYRAVFSNLFRVDLGDVRVRSIRGMEHVDKVIDIDQSPIGKTPRSNPSTYTGLFSWIRDLFAQLPEAQIRGYKAGRFSFNVKGGRCETCEGAGVTRVEMHFLPDVFVTCEVCKGRRYNRETLDVKYKGKSISEVLDMDAAQALEFFDSVPHLKQKLKVLNEVGLGYIRLGQNATTLSGGEAQRIKLARELSRRSTGKTLYILDEPSTGLHFDDVKKLISILQELVEQGNTVIVIEHNLDIIKTADYILDMGPEGGSGGGRVVASGTPEEIAQNPESKTGRFLKGYLK